MKDVMLNLIQHLIKSKTYETLIRVQGDKIVITTQSLKGEGHNGFAPHQETGHKDFPPLQGEGEGGSGLHQMPIQ